MNVTVLSLQLLTTHARVHSGSFRVPEVRKCFIIHWTMYDSVLFEKVTAGGCWKPKQVSNGFVFKGFSCD